MGILDSLMGAAEKHPDISQEQHSNLVSTAMHMFGSGSNLSGLVSRAESRGLGGTVQSWIGNGPNQSIAPQQVQGLVGEDRVNELAQRAGVPHSVASAALSRLLPMIVDKLTPNGKLPQAA
jgi:uncharacterized protein YidB (DUF937 family)